MGAQAQALSAMAERLRLWPRTLHQPAENRLRARPGRVWVTTRGRSSSAFAHNRPSNGWSRCAGDVACDLLHFVIFVHSALFPRGCQIPFGSSFAHSSSLEVHILWIPSLSCPAEVRGLSRSRARTQAHVARLLRGLPPFPPFQLLS